MTEYRDAPSSWLITSGCAQGMANLGEKSEISGSVLLSWHEKVRIVSDCVL